MYLVPDPKTDPGWYMIYIIQYIHEKYMENVRLKFYLGFVSIIHILIRSAYKDNLYQMKSL